MKYLLLGVAALALTGCETIQSITGNGELPKEVNQCYDQELLQNSLQTCLAFSTPELISAATVTDLELIDATLDFCIETAKIISRVDGQCVDDPNI